MIADLRIWRRTDQNGINFWKKHWQQVQSIHEHSEPELFGILYGVWLLTQIHFTPMLPLTVNLWIFLFLPLKVKELHDRLILYTNNLFVTSKNETTNSPIHEFKVLQLSYARHYKPRLIFFLPNFHFSCDLYYRQFMY